MVTTRTPRAHITSCLINCKMYGSPIGISLLPTYIFEIPTDMLGHLYTHSIFCALCSTVDPLIYDRTAGSQLPKWRIWSASAMLCAVSAVSRMHTSTQICICVSGVTSDTSATVKGFKLGCGCHYLSEAHRSERTHISPPSLYALT